MTWMDKPRLIVKGLPYVLSKLAGAGLIVFGFALFMLFASRFDWYETLKTFSNALLWLLFYVYGIGISFLIDVLGWKWESLDRIRWKLPLHMLAGFLFFVVVNMEMNPYVVIAGLIAAVCGAVGYIGFGVSQHKPVFRYIFALAVPFVLLLLVNLDLSIKKAWVETKTPLSYEASFDYFHGEHAVDITVEQGQTILVKVNWKLAQTGGNGYRLNAPKDGGVHMAGPVESSSNPDNSIHRFKADRSGTYQLVVITADHLRNGSFKVEWKTE